MVNFRTSLLCVVASSACFITAGCGGAASGGSPTGSTGGTGGGGDGTLGGSSPAAIAATFQVNVNTGAVNVVSSTSILSGKAIAKPGMFIGNSIGFTSSVLSNDPLNTGLRSLSVSLTNNSDIPIGLGPNGNVTGLNVIFGAFDNTTGVQSQAANTNVSTFAGTTAGFLDGATAVAKLDDPTGVAVAPNGIVYVADYGTNRIRKISGGYVSTLAGNGTAAELDNVATKAEFDGPYGVAVNPADGSVIVADFLGDTIRRVTTTGVVNTIAGKAGSAGNTNGLGSAATFTDPSDVAVDPIGNIYVSEEGSNLIRKIIFNGGAANSSADYTVSTFAGSGTAGLLDGNGAAAEFNKPYGITTDPNGNVYVADYGNEAIRMIDPSANVTTIAGTGTASDLDGYGNAATFNHPVGVTCTNGAVFVSEYSGLKIREVMPVPGGGNTSASWLVETLAGTGSSGPTNGAGSVATFGVPYYIGSSSSSSLYLADYGESQIRRINPSTGTFPIGAPNSASVSLDAVTLSNGNGVADSSDLGPGPFITYSTSLAPGASSSAQPWNFVIPSGVTSFQFQVIVEANTSELIPMQAANEAGSPLVDVRNYAGSSSELGDINGNGSDARFGRSAFLSVDGNGVVYVSDVNNNAIRRIDTNGNVTTIAGVFSSFGYVDGPGNIAAFNGPCGLVVNAGGTEIFVADNANAVIRAIELTGGDPTNAADWTVSTIAGIYGTRAWKDGVGNVAELYYPLGIALTPGGDLYISEGNRIRRLIFGGGSRSVSTNWYVTTMAGDTSTAVGQSGYTNGQGTNALFNGPFGLCCDAFGNLYVADCINNEIREMDTGGNVKTFAGSPTGGLGYADSAGTAARFNDPACIASDSSGYLYVADTANELIRRISPSGNVLTVAGEAQSTGALNGPGNMAEFAYPYAVALSPSGDLFVSDGNGAIRLIQTVINSASTAARPK